MDLLVHIVAILTIVQSTWSSPQTSTAPPIGSLSLRYTNTSTTKATEIRTEFPVSSPSQITVSSVDTNLGTTSLLLMETSKAHSEQNFTKSSSDVLNTTNSPASSSTLQSIVSASQIDQTRTTVVRTDLGNGSTPSPDNISGLAATSATSGTSFTTGITPSYIPSKKVTQVTSEDHSGATGPVDNISEGPMTSRIPEPSGTTVVSPSYVPPKEVTRFTSEDHSKTPSPVDDVSQGSITSSSPMPSITTRVSSRYIPSEEMLEVTSENHSKTPIPGDITRRVDVIANNSETPDPTMLSTSSLPSEEVLQTTPKDQSKSPIPGEPGLRSSPRVASEYIITSIHGVTESDIVSNSSATTDADVATYSSTSVAVLLTTIGELDTVSETQTRLPDATVLKPTTLRQIVTTKQPDLFTTVSQVETTEAVSVESLVTGFPEVTDLSTEISNTEVYQTMQTSAPSAQSTVLPTEQQPLEISTTHDGGTDGTPSTFDPVSLEPTTQVDEPSFNTTDASTVPTTTEYPLEVGSIGVVTEAATQLGLTDETVPGTDMDMETDLMTDMTDVAEGTAPLELWTQETSSSEEMEFDGTDNTSTESMIYTEATTTIETPAVPAPCLCEVETALLSASVCLCNTSLALSNFTYHAHLVRRNHDNMTHPETQVHSSLISSGSGCWNISVPLGGSYRLVVTAEDGLGNIASTPSAYFISGLMPPFLSVKKVPGAMPSLELFWQFPYPTYVDYVTIYRSRDNAPATELTWMRVDDVRTTGQFTFVTSGLGSMYSVAVKVNSGADVVWSNFDSVVLPPPHPEQVGVASVTPELLTVHWPHDTTSCRGNCSYLVRYQQTSPYRYNSYPIRERHVFCPNLLPAQPARSTNPSSISTCTAYFRDLIPGALYDIDVYASSYNVLSVTAAQLRQRIPPTPPMNVTVTNVTEQSITITWLPGPGYRTRYHLHAFAPSYNEEVGQVHGDVTEFTFHNLLAGTRYIISIRASANSTEGEMVLVGETTSPTRPGPVDRLRLEPQIDHRRIRLSFMSPMWHNGVLEGYQVEYIGHRSGNRTCNRGEKYLPVAETSVVIEGLKGGCNYTFTVKARNEVGLGAGVSDWILTAVTIPQVPDTRPPPPPSKTIKSRNFVVNFNPSMFDDVNGEITHVIVIVAESSAANEPTQSNSTPPKMLTWAEAISNDVIPPYQISDPIALRDLVQDTRRKRSVADPTLPAPTTRQISIGTEECSYDKKDVYCNGPLIHGRSYVYRFRGISPGGYADTRNSLPVSLPVSPHGVIIGISTALFSLLVIVIILSIVVIVRKFRLDGRGRYLPANMKDVELTRVANNTHTMSKQKYSRPVRVSDFTRDWFSMNADSNYGYSQEYEAIRKVGRKMTTNTAVSPANVGKNRYTNILPYDRTRVKLSPVDDEEGSDYINANYIPGFSSPREYIACQGPLPGTSDDMWRMIWEQNVTTVVMVTQLVEKGKVKCDQYWPDDHMPVLYGDIQVTMNQTIEENDWNIKEFAVQQRDQRRYVRHWNFLSWPDHGVPESSQALLAFIRKIRSTKPPSSAPIAVHCSAGVGRTGTFIVLDHMLQHMEQYDFVDVMGVVCGMRMHRNFMVQTEQQYVFIHRCLMDVIEERGLAPVPLMSGSLP